MIITTISKYEINKIYHSENSNFFIPNKLLYTGKLNFYILREATRKEYMEYCINEGCEEKWLIIHNYFYEISVD